MNVTLMLLFVSLACSTPAPEDVQKRFEFFETVTPPRTLQAMAHRGAASRAPENTAAAIERSIADSVEWVEIDLRLTKDGHHVLMHDATVDRTTDGHGAVRAKSLAEIQALDAGVKFATRFAGQKVLSLEEALKLARGRVNLYLDCKDIEPAALCKAVTANGMTRQVVVYGSIETLRAVHSAGKGILPLMAKWDTGLDSFMKEVPLAAVEVDAGDLTPELASRMHKEGLKVQAKALGKDDRPEVWERMAGAGADWVQTDLAEEVVTRTIRKANSAARVLVSHHRGASQYAPENTLEAFRKSIALGADYVEFDVRTTKDGHHVLMHDGTLDRTTNGHGPVREKTLPEIRALDAGSWFGASFKGAKVPTLDEFLDEVGTRAELYFDAKDIAPEALAAALRKHGLAGRAVVYQGVDYLARLKAIAPEVRRMPPLGRPEEVESIIERVAPYAFDTRWGIVTRELIARCHARGVKVFSDALGVHETADEYRRAVDAGIDLIQTDHPMRVMRALERSREQAR